MADGTWNVPATLAGGAWNVPSQLACPEQRANPPSQNASILHKTFFGGKTARRGRAKEQTVGNEQEKSVADVQCAEGAQIGAGILGMAILQTAAPRRRLPSIAAIAKGVERGRASPRRPARGESWQCRGQISEPAGAFIHRHNMTRSAFYPKAPNFVRSSWATSRLSAQSCR